MRGRVLHHVGYAIKKIKMERETCKNRNKSIESRKMNALLYEDDYEPISKRVVLAEGKKREENV